MNEKEMMERCGNCFALIEHNNNWLCDEYDEACIEIEHCSLWNDGGAI